jgi:hypothetical protein
MYIMKGFENGAEGSRGSKPLGFILHSQAEISWLALTSCLASYPLLHR